MFVGHYSASFVLKAVRPRVPLWVLFLAAQAVDIGWGVLVLLGVEKARFEPGFTKVFPLDLYYMPYTHSLLAGAIWALAGVALYFLWRRRDGLGAAVAVGAAVLSHWFLDLPMHAADLPLYDDAHKLGFGLWNHPVAATALELGLLGGAVAIYARAFPQYRGAAWQYCILLGLVQIANGFLLPPSALAIAGMALLSYLLFAWGARWVERV